MGKRIPEYLRLHTEEPPADVVPAVEQFPSVAGLCQSFQEATGWKLSLQREPQESHHSDPTKSAPANPGDGTTPGLFRIGSQDDSTAGDRASIDRDVASRLARDLASVYGDLAAAQDALRQREAELAAGVPVMPRTDEAEHLAERLDAILAGGADAVGCHAAEIYLLDDATSELKLRAVWGMSRRRLTEPARPLRGAAGDLEALVGHVVVLKEDTSRISGWKIPSGFRTAVCVPISTPAIPLGTLWLYSRDDRDFSNQQTNIIEIVSGRISAELEREMLLVEGEQAARSSRSLEAAARWQENQLPQIVPVIDSIDLSGWTTSTNTLSSTFFDWFPLADGCLAMAVVDSGSSGVESALLSAQVHGALRAQSKRRLTPAALISRVNQTIWETSVGDQSASMFYAVFDPARGRLRYVTAGDLLAIHVGRNGSEQITTAAAPLGTDAETRFRQAERPFDAGDVLTVATAGIRDARDAQSRPLGESGLIETLADHLDESAEVLGELVRYRLLRDFSDPAGDQALLVFRRVPAN